MASTGKQAAPKILYIDDDPGNRTLVNRLLTSHNFRVTEAENGLKGIEIATQDPPDLILMDINMPGLDGHETTTRMRSITQLANTPIVAVTARTTEGERELALAAGCDGYIPKPIDVDQFPDQVSSFLGGHKETITNEEMQHYLGDYSRKLVDHLESKIVELTEANRKLQNIDKIKSDFISLAAHELRTPITLVYGYARLLQQKARQISPSGQPEPDSIEDLADRIADSTHRLREVTNDILNIALIDANEMELSRKSVNLEELICAALRELKPIENGRLLDIKLDKKLEALPAIIGDAYHLQLAFWNILSNAIKYTPDGGSIVVSGQSVSPSRPTNLDFTPPEKGIILAIEDSGIGIDPAEQEEIFERFYIVGNVAYHSSSKTNFGGGGLGVGLPIARGIIEAHGGHIWAKSPGHDEKTNPGSTFYVFLPLVSFIPRRS